MGNSERPERQNNIVHWNAFIFLSLKRRFEIYRDKRVIEVPGNLGLLQ